tara:strand:- start:149 stop:739 length:591 start_codon:yes stop_codon:yes gene_type:complete
MGFWTQASGDNAMDPKRQYRFIVDFANLGSDCQWLVKNIGKPSISLTEASHQYLNHTFYYPGRVSWNTVSVTLVDPVSPDATATMMNAINAAGYKVPSGPDQLTTVSKKASIASLGQVTITQFAGDGDTSNPVEEWILRNAWIKSVTLSGLDYSGDSLSEVTLELRYDYATLKRHGASPSDATTSIGQDDTLWDVS